MKKLRIAINGFGRIGRHVFKAAFDKKNIEIVAVNDLTDVPTLVHLLKYDTAYPDISKSVRPGKGVMTVGKKQVRVFSEKDPSKLPWKKLKVDVVVESTGVFRTKEQVSLHLKAGAKRVVISAPAKGEDIRGFICGVNSDAYRGEAIIDTASCTTNCTGPVMAVLEDEFGVEKAMMSTIHSYTADQNLQDGPHKDLRRTRAAAQNIVPTSTGAALAVTRSIPSLENKFDGIAFRVPTVTVSIIDVTALLKKNVTIEAVNRVMKKAANGKLKGVLAVSNEPLVSSDYIGNPYASTVDLSLTNVVGGNLVKVVAWYDNEWGYANQLVSMLNVLQRYKK
jgi:glyceraldehyde 3-phosphate dehydrogenase